MTDYLVTVNAVDVFVVFLCGFIFSFVGGVLLGKCLED